MRLRGWLRLQVTVEAHCNGPDQETAATRDGNEAPDNSQKAIRHERV